MWGLRSEPAVWSEIVRQGILVAILFEWIHWSSAQQAGMLMFVSLILAAFTRQASVPVLTIQQAGASPEAIKATAAEKIALDATNKEGKP